MENLVTILMIEHRIDNLLLSLILIGFSNKSAQAPQKTLDKFL